MEEANQAIEVVLLEFKCRHGGARYAVGDHSAYRGVAGAAQHRACGEAWTTSALGSEPVAEGAVAAIHSLALVDRTLVFLGEAKWRKGAGRQTGGEKEPLHGFLYCTALLQARGRKSQQALKAAPTQVTDWLGSTGFRVRFERRWEARQEVSRWLPFCQGLPDHLICS